MPYGALERSEGLGESMYLRPTLRVWTQHYRSPKPPRFGKVIILLLSLGCYLCSFPVKVFPGVIFLNPRF